MQETPRSERGAPGTRTPLRGFFNAFVLALLSTTLLGCRAPDTARSFTFPADDYEHVLAATRDLLRASGYTVERVDAARGEILTAPKVNAGFVTPFEPEYDGLGEMWRDTLNNQPRTVRVRFRDAESVRRGEPAPPGSGEIHAEVDAVLWRTRYPGWRLETETVVYSRYARDPILYDRGVYPGQLVPIRRDDGFAAEFAGRVQQKTRARAASEDEPREG